MGMFSGIGKAKANNDGGAYLKSGHYFARINRVKADVSQQRKGEEYVATELTVVHTFEDGDLHQVQREGEKEFVTLDRDAWHRPGERVSHLMWEKHPSFEGNFKAFVMNVGSIDESQVDEDKCEAACNGAFEGLFVEIRARVVPTRKKTPFTKASYVREVSPSELKERVPIETLDRVLGEGKIDDLIENYDLEDE
jgi:hypothetical protein